TAAAAFGVAEREPELPCEVGAEEVGQVGAVGLEAKPACAVLAEAEMVVQEIALGVPCDLVQRTPSRLRIEGIVEEVLDPGGDEVLGRPAPVRCALPPARPRVLRAVFCRADVDRATCGLLRSLLENRAMGSGALGHDLDVPPVRWPAATLA